MSHNSMLQGQENMKQIFDFMYDSDDFLPVVTYSVLLLIRKEKSKYTLSITTDYLLIVGLLRSSLILIMLVILCFIVHPFHLI
jgi:hypothetical protein